MNKIENMFEKIYKQVMGETIIAHTKNHQKYSEDRHFFNSLTEEQKEMYLKVVLRITTDAAAGVLYALENQNGVEILVDGEKIEDITEMYLATACFFEGEDHKKPVF